ncbi:hypothetical protein P4V43_08520 [Brevibacillus fortis]|uniref:hypothetical protein n=1 Tax=Brevibacillus fortis TaxID=2126352 RepID=UPI002E1DCDF4|nr:hypothetical protein [Brevibacillus fortis]
MGERIFVTPPISCRTMLLTGEFLVYCYCTDAQTDNERSAIRTMQPNPYDQNQYDETQYDSNEYDQNQFVPAQYDQPPYYPGDQDYQYIPEDQAHPVFFRRRQGPEVVVVPQPYPWWGCNTCWPGYWPTWGGWPGGWGGTPGGWGGAPGGWGGAPGGWGGSPGGWGGSPGGWGG